MTFKYREVVIPQRTKKEETTVCDSCQAEGYRDVDGIVDWAPDGNGSTEMVAETCVMMRIGQTWRDGGSEITTKEWHLCPRCFVDAVKVIVNPTVTKTES